MAKRELPMPAESDPNSWDTSGDPSVLYSSKPASVVCFLLCWQLHFRISFLALDTLFLRQNLPRLTTYPHLHAQKRSHTGSWSRRSQPRKPRMMGSQTCLCHISTGMQVSSCIPRHAVMLVLGPMESKRCIEHALRSG